jgi:predicted transcriptional regulator
MSENRERDERVKELIKEFYSLRARDFKIVDEILDLLGLADLAELRLCLENQIKIERDAALRQIERLLDKLLSEDPAEYHDAKQELKEMFHPLDTIDEEA